MEKKKNRIYYLVIGLITVIILGISYAFFSATITGLESTSTIVLNAGTLDIVYADGNSAISLNELYPRGVEWATKDFTITGTNTTNLFMQYTVDLIIDNNTLSDNALTYKLTGEGVGQVVNASGSISGTGTITMGAGSFPNGEDIVHSYVLKIYFPETLEDQSIDKDKTVAMHVGVSANSATKSPIAFKGDLITMNIGEGLPDTYRVLRINGSEALVLAMQDYNVGMEYPYNEISKTTSFNGTEGQQYAGSDLDILLNTTMYGEMNSTAKSAIVAKNINQNMFSRSNEPNELEESEPYTYDYQYQCIWNNNNWENSNLVGTVNVGSRYVYALDVADIYEYIGRRYISSNELTEMFFNQNTSYTTNSTMGYEYIWLRSASSLDSNSAWSVNGTLGTFNNGYNYDNSFGARAAFVIDLSKMGFDLYNGTE